jgi:uncharacterized membrane protein (DUF4010 family)
LDPLSSNFIEAAYATGIGLAIGLEREHSDLSYDVPPEDTIEGHGDRARSEVALGIRTFAMLGLLGWILAVLADQSVLLLPIGLVVVAGILATQFVLVARRGGTLGVTTEIAALAVLCEGAMVHSDRRLAVMLGIVTALLLVAKPWMRRLVLKLRRAEVAATVQLAVLVAIVLPLMPEAPVDRWDALPPRKVATFVVLLAAVEYVGYVLTRILGTQRGAWITGLVGGIASSTAVTVQMARSARRSPAATGPAQLTALLANVVMSARVAIITAVLAPAISWRIAIALGVMAFVLLCAAFLQWRALRRSAAVTVEPPKLSNPFALLPALIWGGTLCAILLFSHWSNMWFGDQGFVAAAAASGIADVDAITLAASRQANEGALSVDYAALAVVVAVISNSISKSVMALVAGGRRFGVRVASALMLASVCSLAAAIIGMQVF